MPIDKNLAEYHEQIGEITGHVTHIRKLEAIIHSQASEIAELELIAKQNQSLIKDLMIERGNYIDTIARLESDLYWYSHLKERDDGDSAREDSKAKD